MTKTKIVVLLSIVALLASLPLTVALAQELPPYTVVGTAMLDGGPAAEGTMVVAMVGETESMGTVVDMKGTFRVDVEGAMGAMVMFSLSMMGEDGEAMEYTATADREVMVGEPGVIRANLMASKSEMEAMPDETPGPTARPTKSADQILTEKVNTAVRNAVRNIQLPAGGEGLAGADGADGPAGADGSDGSDGARGAAGPAGADGSDGSDGARGAAGPAGADGSDGSAGARGAAGSAGPAGADGPAGATGPAGAAGGGGVLAIVALIIAIVGVVAAGGAFIAGRQSS